MGSQANLTVRVCVCGGGWNLGGEESAQEYHMYTSPLGIPWGTNDVTLFHH